MLTVDDYGAIRRARRDGMSIRQISREFGHTRKTIRHVLDHAEPPAPTNRDRKAPRLGPVVSIINRILADDEDAPAKQRHTAVQIHRRLREEHAYPGGYAQVQRYVLKHRRRYRETFISLGMIAKLERITADVLEQPVAELAESVKAAEAANIDETGWRGAHLKARLWVVVTSVGVVFRIVRSRAGAVARDLLGEEPRPIVISDRFPGYEWI